MAGRLGRTVAPLSLLVLAACAGAPGVPADDWTRSYAAEFERVVDAALDSLDGLDYHVEEADRSRGRIRASSSARRGDELTLILRLEARGSTVRVDVMAQGESARIGRAPDRMNAAVAELLRDLDDRLSGRLD